MSLARIATPGLTFDEATHTYRLDGQALPSVTQVLAANGLGGDFSHVSPAVLEHARQRGTAVHAAAHYLDEGDLDEATVDPEIRPYLEAWQAFKVARRVELLALEQRVACPLYRFAGTIDRVARVPGIRGEVLIDLKTNTPHGAAYQLAGYKLLAQHLRPVVTTSVFLERWAVELHPERAVPYTIHEYRNSRDRDIFLAALTLTHERARLGRSWQEAA